MWNVYIYTDFLTVCLIACSGAMAKGYGTVSVIQGKSIYTHKRQAWKLFFLNKNKSFATLFSS